MTNTVNSTNFCLWKQHQANITASLDRRLNRAKAAQDASLVDLLEQERQQISLNHRDHSIPLRRQLTSVWQDLIALITGDSRLKVWQMIDATGNRWWCAYNPQTGQSVYADSEAELRLWIEQNYTCEMQHG